MVKKDNNIQGKQREKNITERLDTKNHTEHKQNLVEDPQKTWKNSTKKWENKCNNSKLLKKKLRKKENNFLKKQLNNTKKQSENFISKWNKWEKPQDHNHVKMRRKDLIKVKKCLKKKNKKWKKK